tara:strand:+ start:1330 stop:1776 length:447 start_codon:yes stop_codon:yes gene_type:complete
MFLIGISNFLVLRTQKLLPNIFIYKQIFVSSLLIINGAISILILIYLYFRYPNKIINFYGNNKNNKIKYFDFMLPGIIRVIYLTINILALSKGGGIASSIFGLSTFITILLNVIYMNYKINFRIIFTIIIICAITAYVTHETIKLNKL